MSTAAVSSTSPWAATRAPRFDEDNLAQRAPRWVAWRPVTAGFERILRYARAHDFIYFDPPYHPISTTSSFTAYTQGSFKAPDQLRLAEVFKELDRRDAS